MKTCKILLLIFVLSGCVTPVGDGRRIVDLIINRTNTPKTTTISEGITSEIRVNGADLCYKFEYFEVKNPSGLIFEISAKGSFPEGNPVCPQAVYTKDTTVKIQPPVSGTYILKFYNGNSLLKSDTVIVN